MRESTKVYLVEFAAGVLIGVAIVGLWHLFVEGRQ